MFRMCFIVFSFAWMAIICGSGPLYAGENGPIRIGATVSLEGKYREPSGMIRQAFKLWEQQVNRGGGLLGRPVRLIVYDDKSRKDLVAPLYEKLINEDKVDLVFSPYGTPLTFVASGVAERHGMVMLACAASGEKIWERGFRHVFGMYALAKRYFIGLLDLMARRGLQNVAILHESSLFNQDVAKGAVNWAKRFRMNVVLKKSFASGKEELPGLLQAVRDVNPDGLILSAYSPDGYELLRLMEAISYRPKVTGITIAPVHPDFYQKAGAMAEGIFGPSQWEPDERIPFPGTKRFIEDFTSFARKRPSYHAGSAYAACQILERAIRHNRSLDQDQIRDFILALDTVTVIGRFKVDSRGKQVGHNPIIIQWQGGKKEIVYPTKMRTATPRFP